MGRLCVPLGRGKPDTIVNFKFRILEGSQPFFGEFEGAEDGAGFILALLVFSGGGGVALSR